MKSGRGVSRVGAVLPMALAIMVIVGLAASTALFTGRLERQSSWNTRLQTIALGAADRGIAELLASVASAAPSLAIGATLDRELELSAHASTTVRLTRLGTTLFVLRSDAHARSAHNLSAHRRTSLLLRLDPPALGIGAALSIVGPIPPDAALADGVDAAPSGWPCGDPRPDSTSIAHPLPPIDTAQQRDLRDRASVTFADGTIQRGAHPTVRDGACETARADNLGDPDRAGPCASWLPVVHARGDLTLDGGKGQGVLLVDGDLTLGGGFRFVGVVIVDGGLRVAGGGGSITGAVIAGVVTDESGSASPAPIVHRSTCAVESALVAAGRLVPVPDRPWSVGR
jgi:hypothetical protein